MDYEDMEKLAKEMIDGKSYEEVEDLINDLLEDMEVEPVSEIERSLLHFINQMFYRDKLFRAYVCGMIRMYSSASTRPKKMAPLLIGVEKLSIALFGRPL